MAYNRDDEDKKNKGGSSSESGSSSSDQSSGGGSNPPSLRDNSYISVSRSGGIGTSTADAFNAARNTYNSALSSGMSRNQAWVYTTRGGYGGSSGGSSAAPGAGVGAGAGAFGSGYLTRGSTAYNQAQAQNSSEPTNWTQRREQSKAETFGIQGLQGVNNGQPDIRSDNWYSGASPTAVDIAARIYALDPNNKEAFDFMNQKRLTPGDETYSPYIVPTSRAVYALAELGVEQPAGGFTKEYCQQALAAAAQAGLLQFSDTSGNVKSPGKHASKDEKIAYHLAKLLDDMDRTDKAEIEWNSFKEDVMFKAGDTSRNMSDEEIWASIDWSKYPTLRQAEIDKRSQQPSEFTRALNIDFNYFSGMCWAARNGGGTGDSFADAVFARVGEGNQYQYNEEIARKRDVNSPDYDPYSLGGTMYDAQVYFGTHELGGDFVNSHRDYGVSSDRTLVGNYQSVAKADDFTVACNEELAKVKGEVDDFLEDYLKYPNSAPPSDEAIADFLNSIFIDNSDYRNIQKLNNSLVNAGKQPLEETTGIIGSGDTVGLYKRSNLERYIQERLSERASNVDPHDAANDTNKGLSGALDRMYNNVGNFFTGLFGPKEPYVPTDENGNPVEVKPEPSKANVQSSLPSMDELVNSGIAVRTASATVSDVGGSLAARPTPTPMPSATPAPGSTNTSAGPSREEYENAKRESEAWQQDMLRKRQNMAQGKFALRDTSSPTDKQTYKSAYPEFDDDVAATKDGIENGGMTEQQSYDSMLGSADALAGKTYFSDVETVESYEALQDIVAREEDQLNGMPDIPGETMPVNPQTGAPMTEDELAAARLDAMQTGDTERWEYLSQFGAAVQTDEDKRAIADKTAVRESYEQHKAQLDAMKPQYDEAIGHLDAIDAKYAMAAEMVTDNVDTGLGVRATDVMDAIRNGFNEVPLPDWSAYDAYAMAEANGESQEQIVAAAKANIANDEEAISQIQALLDMADRYGLNIPDRYRANMQETLRQYEANKKDSEYYLLRTNPDFAEKVAAGDSAEKWAKQKFHTGSSIGYALYAFKHNTADRSLYAQYPLMGQMSQAELDTAQYLLETQGPVTADEYYLHLGDSQYGRLNTRFTEDAMQRAAAFSERNAVGGTVLSIAMAPLNSTGAFQIIFDKVTGRTSNPNSMLSAGQKASSAMRQEAKGQIVNTLSEPFGGADSPVGKVLGLGYDAFTSAGDTAVNMGWGKALGLVGNGSTWMDKLSVSAMNPAAAAGTSSYNEALRKGGSEQQATMMGVVSFLGEWLTEAIEMSDVMDAISTGVSEAAEGAVKGIKAFLKKQIPELGNEIVGEAVSDIVERVGDDVIMGELSDKAKSVDAMTKALMDADPNMTEQLARSEAEYQAELDGWKSTAYAGLLGGVSAGISTAGGYAVGNMTTTTEQFLRAYEVQRDLEAHGMPKANARVAARNIVATNADNTAVYGPQMPSNTAQTAQTETAEETATPVEQTAETANEANPQASADLSTEAARDEQTAMNLDNTEQQTEPVQEPIPTARREQWEQRKQRRHQFASDLNGDSAQTSAQSRATSEQFSRRMFALEQGSMGGTSQKVVAITSVLDQDTASSDELTQYQARAAAQGLVETYGDNAIPIIQRLMMRARTEGVDNGAVMEAVQVAALSDGAANQVFAGLNPRAISTENFNAFMQAANLDMADQEIRGQMRKRTYDVMVAAEKARRISEGAAKDLQAAAERKRSASRRRQHAQEQHDNKVREVENIRQTLAQVNAEYDEDTSGDMENAVRDAVSDLPGAVEAEQQLAQQQQNAEAEEAKVIRETKEQEAELDAQLTRQAQEAVDQKLQAIFEARQRRAEEADARARAEAEAESGETETAETDEPQNTEVTAPETEVVTEAEEVPETTEETTEEDTDVPEADETVPETVAATTETVAPTAETIEASNVGAPNPTPQSRENRQIKSGYEIIRDLENATGIKIDDRLKKYLRGKRKNTKGYTARGRDIVHIQDANDVETAAHEIGHKLSDTFNLEATAPVQKMVDYLMKHDDLNVRAWIRSYQPQQRGRESIAEFCKYWMIDRGLAEQFAGEEFVNEWEQNLASRGWLAPMQQAAQDLRLNRSATSGERAMASLVMETDKPQRMTAHDAFESIFDTSIPLLEMETARKRQEGGELNYHASLDPRTLVLQRNAGSITNFVNLCLKEGLVDPTGKVVLREDGTPWGSLRDITNDIPAERGKTLATLWELLNAKDRAKYGKAVFAEDINVDEAYNQLVKGNEDLVEKIHQIHDWWNQFMQVWVVDTGNLGPNGQKLFDKMKRMYPNYAPAFRPTREQQKLLSSRRYRMGGENAAGVMRAYGSTKPILDPILGISQLAQQYITNYRAVEIMRALENTTRTVDGFSWVMEPAQKDMKIQDESAQNAIASKAVLESLEKLRDISNVDIDQDTLSMAMDEVEKVLNNLPSFSFFAKDSTDTDVIRFPMENGEMKTFTVYSPEIIQAIMYAPPSQASRIAQALGNIVRTFTSTLSMNATSRKLTFPIMNAESDAETAYTTGHAGKTPFDYAYQWFKTAGYQLGQVIDDATGKDVDEKYRLFKLFGKYGSRFSVRNADDQIALRKDLYKKGKKTVGEKITAPLTLTGKGLEEFSGFLEDNTRLNEHNAVLDILANNEDITDYDKALIAAKASHEASTDFKKRGSASEMRYAKVIIPFFNGQLQGIYKTMRMFSSENEGHRKQIAMRLVGQGLVMSLVPAILRNMLLSDDEKEEYELLTPYERNKYHHIKVGDRWIRIKKSQDGIIQMTENVGEVLGDILTGYEGDELGDLYNLATAVASNLVLSLDTSLDPISDALNGTTWSGRSMVGYELQGMSTTEQYNASTTWLARLLSNVPIGDKHISPAGWDYMIKQYFGGLGSFGYEVWDAILEDGDTADNVLYAIRHHFASAMSVDPVYSNTLANTFTSSKNMMAEAIAEAKGGHPVAHFRPELTQSQVDRAIKEARDLTSSKGKIGKINSKLSDLWKKHESILNDTNLTKDEREKRAREVRIEINEQYLRGSEIMNDYWMKYGFKNKSAENFSNFVGVLGELFVERKKVPKYKK